MTSLDEARLAASYQKSSYIESVLRHRMLAEVASELWRRSPQLTLQVFNSEVDDAGFDLVLSVGTAVRYIQLKQSRKGKPKPSCSIRLQFAGMVGSAVVLAHYSAEDLTIDSYSYYGNTPDRCMNAIEHHKVSRSPVKRDMATGKKQVRSQYRDVPVSGFKRHLSVAELARELFPAVCVYG